MGSSLETKFSNVYNDPEEAAVMLCSQRACSIVMFSRGMVQLQRKVETIFALIKEHNATVEDYHEEILPSSGFYWDDMDGDTPVHCVEIGGGTYEHNCGVFYVCDSPNYDVCTSRCKPTGLSDRAMASLAMLGSLILDNGKSHQEEE